MQFISCWWHCLTKSRSIQSYWIAFTPDLSCSALSTIFYAPIYHQMNSYSFSILWGYHLLQEFIKEGLPRRFRNHETDKCPHFIYSHGIFWTYTHVIISFVRRTITKPWLRCIASSSQISFWFCYTHGKFSYRVSETLIKWNILSANIRKPWTFSFKASTGLGDLGGFLMSVFNLFFVILSKTLISHFTRRFSTNVFMHSFPTSAEKSMCCAISLGTSFPVVVAFSGSLAKKS